MFQTFINELDLHFMIDARASIQMIHVDIPITSIIEAEPSMGMIFLVTIIVFGMIAFWYSPRRP